MHYYKYAGVLPQSCQVATKHVRALRYLVNLFKKLRDEFGVSVVYITHDLATAYYVGDRIAVMFRGSIIEMGRAEEVLMRPRHPYTKLLRESIPEADPAMKWRSTVRLSETEEQEFMRAGCKFAGRCPVLMSICTRVMPDDMYDGPVMVKCHKFTPSATGGAAHDNR